MAAALGANYTKNSMQHQQLIHLTQESLTLLENSPQKFQQLYLEKKEMPEPAIDNQRQDIGNDFHTIMKQLLMGLPVSSLLSNYPYLHHWVEGLKKAAPYIFTPASSEELKECEYPCTLMVEGHLLSVVYDMLIASAERAQIVEWTTSKMPSKPQFIRDNWQTRLYLYVLASLGDYKPEEISMTYWFVQSEDLPQSLTLNYDTVQYKQTKLHLVQLIKQLNNWLYRWQSGTDFPSSIKQEPLQEFPSITRPLVANNTKFNHEDLMPNLDEIEEISLFS